MLTTFIKISFGVYESNKVEVDLVGLWLQIHGVGDLHDLKKKQCITTELLCFLSCLCNTKLQFSLC